MAVMQSTRGFLARWGLLSLVGTLLAAFWTFVFISNHVRMRGDIEDAQRELVQMNAAVAQHTVALLKSADSAMRTTDRWLQANHEKDPLTEPRFNALIEEFRRLSGGMLDLRLVSESGQLFMLPTLGGNPVDNFGERSHYSVQSEQIEQVMLVGDPVLSLVTQSWVLPVTWKLREPVRGMIMISAVIDLHRLMAIHDRIRLKPAGTIAVVRSDGMVLSRTPFEEKLIGKNIANSSAYVAHVRNERRGVYVADASVADGAPRMVSFQQLDEYPVRVFVTRRMDEVLSGYNAQLRIMLSVSAGLTLISLVLSLALHLAMLKTARAHRELHRLATIDGLTGVSNRRAFLIDAQREFARADRFSRPLGVLAIDIDHFKSINDSQGHPAGDEVLHQCAQKWQQLLRDQDILGRTGGEEFCVVLPETALEGALQAAERLRAASSSFQFSGKDGDYRVTASIGVATIMAGDEHISQALQRADRALYSAKERGRNRVEQSDSCRPAHNHPRIRAALSA